MYDKKENLKAMLEGAPHLHIPISFFQHFPGEELLGNRCIEAHVRFYEETDFDFIKIMHDGLSAPLDLQLTSLEQLEEYRSLGEKNKYVQEYVKRAAGVNDSLKGKIDTYCNVFSPITLFRRMEGGWKEFFRQNPSLVRDVLMYMAEDLAVMCKKVLVDCGSIGIFLALQGAETGEFSLEEYKMYIQESDKYLIDVIEEYSSYNILHFCGWNGIPNQLELWKGYPGCVVNWDTHVEKLSLPQGRKYFGMRSCMGGLDNRRGGILYAGGKSEVEAETIRILEEYVEAFGNTDGLMFGADCSFLPDFETERFQWVVDTVRKWERERKVTG